MSSASAPPLSPRCARWVRELTSSEAAAIAAVRSTPGRREVESLDAPARAFSATPASDLARARRPRRPHRRPRRVRSSLVPAVAPSPRTRACSWRRLRDHPRPPHLGRKRIAVRTKPRRRPRVQSDSIGQGHRWRLRACGHRAPPQQPARRPRSGSRRRHHRSRDRTLDERRVDQPDWPLLCRSSTWRTVRMALPRSHSISNPVTLVGTRIAARTKPIDGPSAPSWPPPAARSARRAPPSDRREASTPQPTGRYAIRLRSQRKTSLALCGWCRCR